MIRRMASPPARVVFIARALGQHLFGACTVWLAARAAYGQACYMYHICPVP
ncbi:hypothetical protein PR003_g2434 [Phytophthora rubi]|uniref:Uncharacterized protein n=1 Tax=Phytophthora rubi TaxID=129364 RepID=A0A6A3JAX6_9STRA|nr:hypothetical protein PR002_g20589 [Phytophthora rubi]KAE9050609.1 hypothetical protein PR001_g2240 [Phytophthora rubi]KAE9356243.1 hypothetical protein PR003_g2434 [Phytophthora rubi]